VRSVLLGTIWVSLALFVAGERGRLRGAAWALRVWTLGAVLCAAHMLVAFLAVYGGSAETMVEETARQTASVYGLAWGGGAYVNVLFLASWIAEVVWWRAAPAAYQGRPPLVTWLLRGFYFVIILNGAVIFAHGAGRIAGALLVAAWMWIVWSGSE